MKDETDERLLGQGMSMKRIVWGDSESANDWNPHSRRKLKLEGKIRVNGSKVLLCLQKPGILEENISCTY